MNTALLLALIFVALLVIAEAIFRLFGAEPRKRRVALLEDRLPAGPASANAYEALPALLSPAERSFFGVLQQAVTSAYFVFPKVRLADIVQPVPSSSRSGWQSAFNRIAGKHVDFVLCDSAHLRVVAVVELDDEI